MAPLGDPPQNQLFERLNLSRYFADKYFDIVWGCRPPGTPQKQTPENQYFDWLKLGN